jgi:dihydroorotate dehydrogenase (fumarate)
MVDLKTEFCGVTLDNPFILGSCPLSYSAEGLIRATKAGAAAVVTKTIRTKAAVNPKPHMVLSGKNSLINTELWSDFPPEQWVKEEIPRAKDGGVKCLIANVISEDNNLDRFLSLAVPLVEAGADMIEVGASGYFESGNLVDFGKAIKKEIKVPVIVKVSANWSNSSNIIDQCKEAGFDAITAMDSMGPATRLDLTTGAPLVGGNGGYGWVTGSTIFPFALHTVRNLAQNTNQDIMGLGGITTPDDALEMLLAGASTCGVCTAPIIKGVGYFAKLIEGLEKSLEKHGFSSVKEAIGKSLAYSDVNFDHQSENFTFDAEKCIECGQCEKVCSYAARTIRNKVMKVDAEECRVCGLCFTACPTGAITLL